MSCLVILGRVVIFTGAGMNPRQWLVSYWNGVNKRHLVLAGLLFVLALAIRGYMMKWELFFEFDTYFHARIVSYLLQGQGLPSRDPMAYYQLGGTTIPGVTVLFWYASAFLYKLFTLGAAYNKEVWIYFVKFLPAFYGALISVAMFYLGKEMYGPKAGAAMGFFAAVTPAFVYRTMAGQFEDDALGFIWLVLGFLFLVRAAQSKSADKSGLKNAVIAGVLFGLMAWTWDMFLLIPFILAAYGFWTIALLWFKNVEKKEILHFGKLVTVAFLLFAVFATANPASNWTQKVYDYTRLYLPVSAENIERAQTKAQTTSVIGFTVGEENTGKEFFGTKYNALIVFPVLALLLIPYRVLRKKADKVSLLVFFWTLITFYMAWSKLKFTYTLGLSIPAAAGAVTIELFEFLHGRPSLEKKTLLLPLGFMLLVGAGAAMHFMTEQYPSIEQAIGWKDALAWMRNETPVGSKMFNWWDEGHWISFIGERRPLVDNRNNDFQADSDWARFYLTEDLNEAYAIVRKYDADYVVLSNDLLGKMNSLGFYAYNTTDVTDARLSKFFGNFLECSPRNNGQSFQCGPNAIPAPQLESIPSSWRQNPNQLFEQKTPMYVYRDKNNRFLYFLNVPSNIGVGPRLWFYETSTQEYFTQVYENAGVKIFKVKK